MTYKQLVSLITIAITFSLSNSVNGAELSKHLSTIVVPEPIERIAPKYPISAARQGREGWAILSFVIDEEGSVQDIIVKGSSGSKDLTRAATTAAKKWRYKPAMENGKAIPQCVNMVKLNFKMGKHTTGASRKFISRYKKARTALAAKDFVTLEALITQMNKDKYMHLSESNYLNWLSADYAKEQGNKAKQLFHLNRVANALESLATEQQKLSVLYQVFSLEIELNKFQAAFSTYEDLQKLAAAEPYLEQLAQTMAQVEDLINSDKNLVIAAKIKNNFWSTALVRKEFSLTEVSGFLHTLDVRCANKRHVYTIEENSTWKLPASWENCSIYVFGEPKTSFKLVELPIQS